MAHQFVDLNTVKYFLFDVHKIDTLFSTEKFGAFDRESMEILINSVMELAEKEFYPYLREMDEKPSYYEDGKIIVHPQFEKVFKQIGEMGFVGPFLDEEHGGMELPYTLYHSTYFILEAANNHITGYLGLTAGAANLIASFGSEELKKKYVPNMLTMKWGGTMCLTEPQAGSSLSDIETKATPLDDGTFKIEGQKIFISSGDHQYAENFIHLVLARKEGAPKGVKGISLFVVPKYRMDGEQKTYNHVGVLGEFEKLGQRGYCTTHLGFSDGGDSIGWLVGEENRGLQYMFQMMNEARIATGRMGAGIASGAYYASLNYAMERPQGRRLNATGSKNADEPQTLIINHPDVKRMLFLQKAIVEGSLSLLIEASHYLDKEVSANPDERSKYNLLLELLTPIAKTYPAEKGRESVDNGLQILGGYGFTMDFDLQQYYRDIRIISLYEGTTGIQSLDLLGRKATIENGKALTLLAEEMMVTIGAALKDEKLAPYAEELGKQLGIVKETIETLLPYAAKGDFERFLADATIFMDLLSTVVIGWQWLKVATKASSELSSGSGRHSKEFLEGKIHTMKFFFKYEISRVRGLSKTLTNDADLTLSDVSTDLF